MISESQKQFRKGKLGASDAGAALGVSPFKTRAQLAAEILGLAEKEYNESANYGNILEPSFAKMYDQKMGAEPEPFEKTLVHPEYEWLICHPDYHLGRPDPKENTLVEFKSVGPRMNRGWGDDGDPKGVPVYVEAQCAVQAMLSGIHKVDVAAYFGGTDFRVYPLEFTQTLLDKVLAGLKEFWGYIERKEMPPLTEDDSEVPQQFFPKHIPEKTETADARITELAKRSAISRRLKKQYEDEYKALDIEIKAYMKASEGLVDSDGKLLFTWKADKDSEKVDWEKAFNSLCEWLTKFSAIADGLDEKTQNIIKRHTTPVTGSRKLLCKIKEEE